MPCGAAWYIALNGSVMCSSGPERRMPRIEKMLLPTNARPSRVFHGSGLAASRRSTSTSANEKKVANSRLRSITSTGNTKPIAMSAMRSRRLLAQSRPIGGSTQHMSET